MGWWEAFKATCHTLRLESVGQIVIRATIAIIGLAALWLIGSQGQTWNTVIATIASVGALVLVFVAVYLWHLFQIGRRITMSSLLVILGAIGAITAVILFPSAFILQILKQEAMDTKINLVIRKDQLATCREKILNQHTPAQTEQLRALFMEEASAQSSFMRRWRAADDSRQKSIAEIKQSYKTCFDKELEFRPVPAPSPDVVVPGQDKFKNDRLREEYRNVTWQFQAQDKIIADVLRELDSAIKKLESDMRERSRG